MTRRPVIAAGIAALLVSACTVGPNYTKPELAVVPQAFSGPQPAQQAGSAIDPATWWESFGDPQLTALVQQALKDNPNVAIAASRVRAARLGEIQARARDKPTINASGRGSVYQAHTESVDTSGIGRLLGGAGTTGSSGSNLSNISVPEDNTLYTYSAGFDASWEIDLFGGARRGVESAIARTEAAVWNERDAAVTLSAEIADAYLALRMDQEQIAVVQREIAEENRGLEIAGHISKAGLQPDIDVIRQRGNVRLTEAKLQPIQADLAVRIHALGILTGQAPAALQAQLSAPVQPLGAAPSVPAGLPSDLLRRRPDIRAAERNLAAATADIGVAVADLYPKLSLTGAINQMSLGVVNLLSANTAMASGGGALSFPLLDFGRRKATVGMRREDREQSYQQYKQTVLQALKDVEDALVQLDAERKRNAELRHAQDDTERTASSTEARYRAGFVAQDELLNAQDRALQAREQVVMSDAQIRQQTVALFKAMGGGWQETMAQPKPAIVDPKHDLDPGTQP